LICLGDLFLRPWFGDQVANLDQPVPGNGQPFTGGSLCALNCG
jgi:hypothetical protein